MEGGSGAVKAQCLCRQPSPSSQAASEASFTCPPGSGWRRRGGCRTPACPAGTWAWAARPWAWSARGGPCGAARVAAGAARVWAPQAWVIWGLSLQGRSASGPGAASMQQVRHARGMHAAGADTSCRRRVLELARHPTREPTREPHASSRSPGPPRLSPGAGSGQEGAQEEDDPHGCRTRCNWACKRAAARSAIFRRPGGGCGRAGARGGPAMRCTHHFSEAALT